MQEQQRKLADALIEEEQKVSNSRNQIEKLTFELVETQIEMSRRKTITDQLEITLTNTEQEIIQMFEKLNNVKRKYRETKV